MSYLAALHEVCTVEDWREIVAKAVEQGKRGDHRARQWLSLYLIAEPQEAQPSAPGRVVVYLPDNGRDRSRPR